LALGLASSRDAFAQPQSQAPLAPAAPEITMPRLLSESPAHYPEQALKDKVTAKVTVNLILELDANGRVQNATVPEPQGHGFDEAAASAASGLVFAPATRNGTPIAAKIKYSYAFEPPGGRITGKILRSANDAPIEGAMVIVTDAAGPREVTTGPDGSYRVENVAPGKVHVHVEAKHRKVEDLDEDIGPGEEASVVLRLEPIEEAPPPPPPGQAPDEPIEEVRVKGAKPPREVTKRTISREEMALMPGTNGDALRSLQNLPGVARPPPFGGQLAVRGSAPQDTNYFVDGTNIPLIYHFGGLSSVLPTEVLDRIDFYPGSYSTQYGRGMGGIIDVAVRSPKDDGKVHGMAQVDLIDARVVAERSLGKGWSFLVGGRRSYFDLWLGPILKASAGVSTAPRYYDYQVMLNKKFGPDHELRFFFFGSDDRLEIFSSDLGGDFVLGGGIRAATTFWRVQARYFNKINDKTRITAVAAIGQDYLNFGFGSNYLDLTITPISGRAEVSHRIARPVTVNLGIDILHSPFDIGVRFPRPQRPGVPDSGLNNPQVTQQTSGGTYTPATYAEFEVQPWTGARLVPGLRVDYLKFTETQTHTSGWDISPRITARQDLTTTGPKTTLKGGVGVFYQPPQPQEMDFVFGRQNLKTNRSVHYTAGLEQEVGPNLHVSVEGFYKALDRLVVQDLGNTGDGRVYGSEWLVRWQDDPKMFGWLAYTLMRSERRENEAEDLHLFQYDQTHILTALLSRQLGDGWRVSGRFRLVSGNLYNANNYGPVDLDRATYQPVASFPQYGSRLGAFHQLDFRVDKTLEAKPLKLSIYLDIQNIYFHRSQEGVSYNFNYTQSAPVLGLPILPILGLRGDL
jgi:TonB family protein